MIRAPNGDGRFLRGYESHIDRHFYSFTANSRPRFSDVSSSLRSDVSEGVQQRSKTSLIHKPFPKQSPESAMSSYHVLSHMAKFLVLLFFYPHISSSPVRFDGLRCNLEIGSRSTALVRTSNVWVIWGDIGFYNCFILENPASLLHPR